MITVKRYSASHAQEWNDFVSSSANGTFILNRGFLEYHKDRFTDHSLMLSSRKKLVAVLPASKAGNTIISHGGLTYGGLIVGPNTKFLTTLSCFYSIMEYYHRKGFKKITYKPVPSFFHTKPFFQDLYALFLLHARLTAMNTGFVADLTAKPAISARRLRMVKKAKNAHITIVKTRDCRDFWNSILIPHLDAKFGAKPVHTLSEIETLRKLFPSKILQYEAHLRGDIVAGVTIFFDRGVAHAQYIAGSEIGRKTGALDWLFWHLVTHEFSALRFFSFGTTNMGSPDGRALSRGLVEWKEGFDTTMFPYPCYDIETKNYMILKEFT